MDLLAFDMLREQDTHIGPSINSYFMPSMYRTVDMCRCMSVWWAWAKKMGKIENIERVNWNWTDWPEIKPSEFDAVKTFFSNIVVAASSSIDCSTLPAMARVAA